MKVISLTEPFATLILNGKKLVETRSWKTSYRGELYIHASMTKISKHDEDDYELMSLIEDRKLNYGYIVCKCNLVDCVYMTKEYVEKMKKNNYQEYICGEYEEGRYAWILEDVIPLKNPIKAKGQLSIWNYYNELEIMELMKNIEYGFVDKERNKYKVVDDKYQNNYILQSPNEVIKNKIGLCLDQVELERYYFKSSDLNIKTYFIVYDDNMYKAHTFLTFEKNNKYYWFEHSWGKFMGIHEYISLKELLLDIKLKFIRYELDNNYNKEKFTLYEYKRPKYHVSLKEFCNHCSSGKLIDITLL